MGAILCDGCGQPATPEHIAERIRRLELATRYRPIHIQVLFLADAPPPGIENDFYNTAATDGSGILIGENLAERFFKALDIPSGPGNREDCLAEFQRRGYFLAFSVECPSDAAGPLVKRLGPVVVKRIQLSYKPRFIVLLSSNTQPMIRVLQEAGLGKRLILRNGSAVNWPLASDSSALAKESAVLRSLLAEIQEHTKAD
ncbi:MAG TPA: hypothetical protein VK156_01325 [Candidatus Limnocylindria bacterium]|nr:hypothetical protein [Candidatus Limnocylindria bacterium]